MIKLGVGKGILRWCDGVAETRNKRMEDEAEEELEGGLGVESWGWSEEGRARLEQNDRALVAIHG